MSVWHSFIHPFSRKKYCWLYKFYIADSSAIKRDLFDRYTKHQLMICYSSSPGLVMGDTRISFDFSTHKPASSQQHLKNKHQQRLGMSQNSQKMLLIQVANKCMDMKYFIQNVFELRPLGSKDLDLQFLKSLGCIKIPFFSSKKQNIYQLCKMTYWPLPAHTEKLYRVSERHAV